MNIKDKIHNITRRNFFKMTGSIVAAGGIYGLSYTKEAESWKEGNVGSNIITRDYSVTPLNTKLVIVKHGNPQELVQHAIEELGGISHFIKRGDKVAIKPNIGWDRPALMAANTNPEVVSALVRLCKDAGASQVIVGDVSCNDAALSYQHSGIVQAVEHSGGTIVLPEDNKLVEMNIGGTVVKKFPVFRDLIEVDKIINLGIAKHHTLARYTGIMKNWYGLVSGNRSMLHQRLATGIVEFCKFIKPTLAIIDGYRVLLRNGPQGGSLSDTRKMETLIASIDQVACDVEGAKLIGAQPDSIPYIMLAHRKGIGQLQYSNDQKKEVDLRG